MMMLMVMVPVVVACGSDDEDDVARDSDLLKQAIGTWMCTQSRDSAMGKTYDGLMVGKQVTINANGTFTSTAPTFGYSGTYTIKGNSITATNTNGDTFVLNVTISGDNMTWRGTASNGTSFQYVFIRE